MNIVLDNRDEAVQRLARDFDVIRHTLDHLPATRTVRHHSLNLDTLFRTFRRHLDARTLTFGVLRGLNRMVLPIVRFLRAYADGAREPEPVVIDLVEPEVFVVPSEPASLFIDLCDEEDEPYFSDPEPAEETGFAYPPAVDAPIRVNLPPLAQRTYADHERALGGTPNVPAPRPQHTVTVSIRATADMVVAQQAALMAAQNPEFGARRVLRRRR
jgi:hypothetical protein